MSNRKAFRILWILLPCIKKSTSWSNPVKSLLTQLHNSFQLFSTSFRLLKQIPFAYLAESANYVSEHSFHLIKISQVPVRVRNKCDKKKTGVTTHTTPRWHHWELTTWDPGGATCHTDWTDCPWGDKLYYKRFLWLYFYLHNYVSKIYVLLAGKNNALLLR